MRVNRTSKVLKEPHTSTREARSNLPTPSHGQQTKRPRVDPLMIVWLFSLIFLYNLHNIQLTPQKLSA